MARADSRTRRNRRKFLAGVAFAGFVRSTNRSMPPFSEKILSDEDLADIYAYLRSIPKPPAVNDIPLLKQ
jgi:mono/diheme cytochrome c family protein